jgi:small conductance mechanosensitive channel
MDVNALMQNAAATLVAVAWKVVGALVLWLVGRWLIAVATRLLGRALSRQQFDVTLTRYLQKGLSVVLNIALVVAILGFFGVETTTFAALIAAGGVAIGVAWGGLLANFAAGAFLVFLRPFKVGDVVTAGGVTGTVDAIGLFGTTINTPDNVLTIVGNNKIFSENIQNFSANAYRRVDLTATISNDVDHHTAIRLLRERLTAIPNARLDSRRRCRRTRWPAAGRRRPSKRGNASELLAARRRRRQFQQFAVLIVGDHEQRAVAELKDVADAALHVDPFFSGDLCAIDREADERFR